jgi:hypothetical protein
VGINPAARPRSAAPHRPPSPPEPPRFSVLIDPGRKNSSNSGLLLTGGESRNACRSLASEAIFSYHAIQLHDRTVEGRVPGGKCCEFRRADP